MFSYFDISEPGATTLKAGSDFALQLQLGFLEMMIRQRWLLYWPGIYLACTRVRVYRSRQTRSSHADAVPGTTEILVVSPFLPKYTIHNEYLGISTTFTVKNFDPRSVQQTIPPGVAAYVKSVTINGVEALSRCHFDFYDVFRVGGEVVIEVTADKDAVNDCGASLPFSLSTGGFDTVQ